MTSKNKLKTRAGTTLLRNEAEAVRELFSKIKQKDMEAVIFFCSSHYDLEKLGRELKNTFTCPLIGCTTAGEISSAGYQSDGMVAVSLSSPELKVHPHVLAPLQQFGLSEAQELAETVRQELVFTNGIDNSKDFGLLLIDGLSIREEQTVATLSNHFEGMPIAGGSAGDGLDFRETRIYADGQFITNAALFTVFETTLPFHVFQTQHFEPTDKKLVITEADPSRRIVSEINAEPAAHAFADMLGLSTSELSPEVFSKYPLMLRIGDHWYVRSVQRVNEDGSLSFYCAIDVGLVLTIGEGGDMAGSLRNELKAMCQDFSRVDLVIGFDCILRKLEILENGQRDEIENVLNKVKFVGFSTYGEQFNSIHVNQTMTGVIIGG